MAKASQRSGKAQRGRTGGAGAPEDLSALKVPELRERARHLDIAGVSGMKKDQLIAAVSEASGTGTGDGPDGAAAADEGTMRMIDEKLAEVLGLARAAREATSRVAELAEEDRHRKLLAKMGGEAEETARRCTEALGAFGARRTAIEDKAGETASEAIEMMRTYLGGKDVEVLDGFEFLIMAEAGETGHWHVLRTMNERAGIPEVRKLTDFAIPVQERHAEAVTSSALELAAGEDPLQPS